jgi:hypothetical protein
MNEKTHLGLSVLFTGFVLGLLTDLLLRVTPWGINFAAWIAALAAGFALLMRRWEPERLKKDRWLFPPAILFAAAFAWRDSSALKTLNFAALLVSLSLLTMRAQLVPLRAAGVIRYAYGAALTGINALCGILPLFFMDIKWDEIPRKGWSYQAVSVARGLLLAFPLLFVFGGLLMAADAVFEGILKNIFDINWEAFFKHSFFTGIGLWLAAGFLRGLFLGREPLPIQLGTIKAPSLGVMETSVALGLLNLLFMIFVVVQIRYFFGGANLVEVTEGLTYAQYARKGFFELAAASGLALPILLGGHWLLNKENPKNERIFRWLAGFLILLLFVVMVSAFQRMRLYQNEYGLTELRLYTTAFMGWLAAVFIWFVATVLRGKRGKFAFGAVLAGFAALLTLQTLNPDRLIVKTNLALAKENQSFDAYYVSTLSDDAIPALVEALPSLKKEEQFKIIHGAILPRMAKSETDWRSWSWGRSRAEKALRESETSFRGTLEAWNHELFSALNRTFSF